MRSGFPVVAAITLVGVPLVVAAILLFGGGQVNACLGGTGCGLEPPTPMLGLLGQDIAGVSAIALGVGWLLLAALVAFRVWQRDRRRVRRVLVGLVLVIVVTGLAVATVRFMDGMPRRTIVADAAIYAIGAALIVAPLALGWAVLTVRRERA